MNPAETCHEFFTILLARTTAEHTDLGLSQQFESQTIYQLDPIGNLSELTPSQVDQALRMLEQVKEAPNYSKLAGHYSTALLKKMMASGHDRAELDLTDVGRIDGFGAFLQTRLTSTIDDAIRTTRQLVLEIDGQLGDDFLTGACNVHVLVNGRVRDKAGTNTTGCTIEADTARDYCGGQAKGSKFETSGYGAGLAYHIVDSTFVLREHEPVASTLADGTPMKYAGIGNGAKGTCYFKAAGSEVVADLMDRVRAPDHKRSMRDISKGRQGTKSTTRVVYIGNDDRERTVLTLDSTGESESICGRQRPSGALVVEQIDDYNWC